MFHSQLKYIFSNFNTGDKLIVLRQKKKIKKKKKKNKNKTLKGWMCYINASTLNAKCEWSNISRERKKRQKRQNDIYKERSTFFAVVPFISWTTSLFIILTNHLPNLAETSQFRWSLLRYDGTILMNFRTFIRLSVWVAPLKGSHFWFLFDFTAAGVVPCGGRKTSPRTSTIVQFIFYFGPLRSAIIFWEIRNKWLV